jgi:hypothetical protein
LVQALCDFSTLIWFLVHHSMQCQELVADVPSYISYYDALKLGASSIWLLGNHKLCADSAQPPSMTMLLEDTNG